MKKREFWRDCPMKKLTNLALLAALAASGPAAAETGFYGGLGIGISKTELDSTVVFDDGVNTPVPAELDFAENDVMFKIFGGYRFFDFLGFEAGWTYLGKPDGDQKMPDQPLPYVADPNTRLSTELEVKGYTLNVVGYLPIGEQWELFGKVGAFIWDADDIQVRSRVDTAGSPSSNSPVFRNAIEDDTSGEDLMAGFGVDFLPTDDITLRAEFEYYDVDDTDKVYSLGFSAIYRFQ
jgi:opacity protein-like surface antigen